MKMRNKKPYHPLHHLIPFLVLGVSLALIVGILFVFAYVLIWGLIIGGVLWIASVLKEYFFPVTPPKTVQKEKTGRIIEHDVKK